VLLVEHNIKNFGEEGHTQLNMNEHGHGSLASLEKWHNYDLGGMLDQLCSSSYWFNSWIWKMHIAYKKLDWMFIWQLIPHAGWGLQRKTREREYEVDGLNTSKIHVSMLTYSRFEISHSFGQEDQRNGLPRGFLRHVCLREYVTVLWGKTMSL
jgi:hypothetical protein